jgi:hypothetical protein
MATRGHRVYCRLLQLCAEGRKRRTKILAEAFDEYLTRRGQASLEQLSE